MRSREVQSPSIGPTLHPASASTPPLPTSIQAWTSTASGARAPPPHPTPQSPSPLPSCRSGNCHPNTASSGPPTPSTSSTSLAATPVKPQFPPHNAPRIWLLSSIGSPIALSLARVLLAHGDHVIGTAGPADLAESRNEHFRVFLDEIKADLGHGLSGTKRMGDRFKLVSLDRRMASQCQSGVATAVAAFGRIDILVCFAEDTLIGSVQEAVLADASAGLLRDTFELNFFTNVNLIKAVVPIMRRQNTGHIIVLTGTSAQIALPGMGLTCASQWALEGYCDSLAYECAPFNIRVSVLQSNFETRILASRLSFAPVLPDRPVEITPASRARQTIHSLVSHVSASRPVRAGVSPSSAHPPSPAHPSSRAIQSPGSVGAAVGEHISAQKDSATSTPKHTAPSASTAAHPRPGPPTYDSEMAFFFSPLAIPVANAIVAETVYAVTAIGGHDNPPLHHLIGQDGTADAREKDKIIRSDLAELGAIAELGKGRVG